MKDNILGVAFIIAVGIGTAALASIMGDVAERCTSTLGEMAAGLVVVAVPITILLTLYRATNR